jgi:hypothetical protein
MQLGVLDRVADEPLLGTRAQPTIFDGFSTIFGAPARSQ